MMIIRRGRNWVCVSQHADTRYDGWWLFGYWAWTPRRLLIPIAVWYRLKTGNNNFFYVIERRRRLPFSDRWIFSL